MLWGKRGFLPSGWDLGLGLVHPAQLDPRRESGARGDPCWHPSVTCGLFGVLVCDEGALFGGRCVVKHIGMSEGDEFVWKIFQGMLRAHLMELRGREGNALDNPSAPLLQALSSISLVLFFWNQTFSQNLGFFGNYRRLRTKGMVGRS